MQNLENVVLTIAVFGAAVAVVYILARYTFLVKKAMIDKGLEPAATGSKSRLMESAILVIGIGLGLLVSSMYTVLDLREDTADLLVYGTVMLFGGAALLIAQIVRKKLESSVESSGV